MEKVTVVSWECDNGAGYEYFIDPALAKKFYDAKITTKFIDNIYMETVEVSCLDRDVVMSQVEHELYVGGV